MSKFIITIEEITEDKSAFGKILLWIFILWWVYMLYFVLIIAYYVVIFPLFVLPAKLIINGVNDEVPAKTITGIAIYLFVVVAVIIGLVTAKKDEENLKFEGLEDSITVVYGEEFDYLAGIKLVRDDEVMQGSITYVGNVDVFTLGDYIVSYTGVFEDETIKKEVKVTVVAYYSDSYVTVLQKFTITKTAENQYTVTGVIENKSKSNLSKVAVDFYCVETDTVYNINFNNGMPTGEQSFSVIFNSNEPLDQYNFKINKIICY